MRNNKADNKCKLNRADVAQIKSLKATLEKTSTFIQSTIPFEQWVAIRERSAFDIDLYNFVTSGLLEIYRIAENELEKLCSD